VFWYRRQTNAGRFTSDRQEVLRRFQLRANYPATGVNLIAEKSRIVDRAARDLADALTSNGKGKPVGVAYQDALGDAHVLAEELYAVESDLIASLKTTLGTLAGLEGKKALIYLGAELPDNPAIDVFQQIDGLFRPYVQITQPPEMREQGRRLSRELRSIARDANANGVTMYMIDAADRNTRIDASSRMSDPTASFIGETNTPLAMQMIASLTGGLSVPGGKSFDAALQTIVADLSSYYSLGYRSPEGKGDRRITVKVKRDGLRVRSRSSYVAKDGEEDMRDRVIANVFNPSMASDFPVRIEVGTPEKQGRTYRLPITVTLPSTITLIPEDDQLKGEFAVYIATGKEEGAVSEVSKAVQPMKFPADAEESIVAQETFTYTTTLVVRSGEQVISVGVADTLAGTIGLARATVDVK
jgi:VWFA-related protein